MDNYCENCKHAHKWNDERIHQYETEFFNLIGRLPCRCDTYDCDKIPKGTKWTEDGKEYEYEGYSLAGECYDDVFHCFELKGEIK